MLVPPVDSGDNKDAVCLESMGQAIKTLHGRSKNKAAGVENPPDVCLTNNKLSLEIQTLKLHD